MRDLMPQLAMKKEAKQDNKETEIKLP